jgi:EmrB/QacA subfamily drug resistance transporter
MAKPNSIHAKLPFMPETTDFGHPRRWLVLVVLCLVLITITMQVSILNTALPTLVRELGASDAQLQWIVDSYIVVIAGLTLTGAAVGDKYGRKKALILGLSITLATVAGASLATDPTQLIVWRALMGIGAALTLPATLSILVNVFREVKERRKAIAYWSLMNAIGSFLGPITGGLLLAWFSWQSCFIVNVPILLVTIVLCAIYIPESKDPFTAKFDLLGALFSTVTLASFIWAVIEGPGQGWTSVPILSGFTIAILFAMLFFWWENQTKNPMFELSLLKSPQLSAAALTLTFAFIAMAGAMFLATLSLQLVRGYSPLQAAIATSGPVLLVNLIVVPRAPWIMQRFGLRKTIAFGTGLTGVAALSMTVTSTTSPYWMLGLAFACMAMAFSVFMPASTEAMMTAVPTEKAGGASALNQITRQTGQALGIALLGGIATVGFQSRFSQDSSTITQLTPEQLSGAGSSLSAAVQLAETLPIDVHNSLMEVAGASYLYGMRIALIVAAGLAFIGAIYAVKAIPARISQAAGEQEIMNEAENIAK